MESVLKMEDIFIQIKDKLNKDDVKLWLLPYYSEITGTSEEDLQRLAADYSKSLNLPSDACYAAISEFQTNALEKLKQRNRFKESGVATIKVKILRQNHSAKITNKEVSLGMLGLEFKQSLVDQIGAVPERCKLISNGLLLKDNESLASQGIRNSSLVLIIILNESVAEIKEKENRYYEIELTKADTSLLAADSFYMQLEDQHGNIMHIPQKEKRALMVAMALHEKGRSALKKEDYARALVFFLDADKEFSQCNSQLLNSVDNYALLDLDIAWCYLCLQSLIHLPESYERLKRCEECFHKSYGPNLERLIAVKGTPGNEAALFMRLHLLQAIVLYHQNKRQEARELLQKAKNELSSLKVDENSLMMLIELGFSPAEARLGLRATQGDVNSAANYINENRTKRAESRKKVMAERILRKERKKMGMCVDGNQYVDPNFVKMLVNMGYSRKAAQIALQKSNNIISDSIQYIQENPLPGPSNSRSQEYLSLLEDLIPELEAAGFDYNMAKLALKKNDCDVMKAAEELLANNGIIDSDFDDLEENRANQEDKVKEKLKEDAYNRLAQDISMVDDDHLDLILQKEEIFLKQYLNLLDHN